MANINITSYTMYCPLCDDWITTLNVIRCLLGRMTIVDNCTYEGFSQSV